MDTATIAIIAVVGLVVLAGVVLLAAARRNETQKAIGALSRETRSRDRGTAPHHRARRGQAHRSGKELELARQARAPRSRQGARHRRRIGPGRLGPARPRHARRHPSPVPQPLHHRLLRASASPASAPRCIAFLWPKLGGGFGSARSASATSTTSSPRSRPTTASSTSPRAACGSPSTPPARSRRPGPCTRRPSWPAWKRASSPSTRSACTSAAACPSASPRSGSSARATAAVQPGRREEGRPRPSWPRPLRHDRRRRRPHRRHRHRHPGPAHRHQHHRPGGRRPPLHRPSVRALITEPRSQNHA